MFWRHKFNVSGRERIEVWTIESNFYRSGKTEIYCFLIQAQNVHQISQMDSRVCWLCSNLRKHQYANEGFFNFVWECFSVLKLRFSLQCNLQAYCSVMWRSIMTSTWLLLGCHFFFSSSLSCISYSLWKATRTHVHRRYRNQGLPHEGIYCIVTKFGNCSCLKYNYIWLALGNYVLKHNELYNLVSSGN